MGAKPTPAEGSPCWHVAPTRTASRGGTPSASRRSSRGNLAAGDRLPDDGVAFHYRPLEFAKWINGVTWASEWPKYQVVDAANHPVARPARPRSRRV